MKKSRFSKYQIINILKVTESGIQVDELCQKYGSAASFYGWRAKYDGITSRDATDE